MGIYLFVSFFCFSFWVCISEDIDKCIRQREIDTENDLTKRPFHARLYQKNAKWISVKNLLSLKEYRFKWENYYHHNYYSFESSSPPERADGFLLESWVISKSPQVSRTFLNILADLYNAVCLDDLNPSLLLLLLLFIFTCIIFHLPFSSCFLSQLTQINIRSNRNDDRNVFQRQNH